MALLFSPLNGYLHLNLRKYIFISFASKINTSFSKIVNESVLLFKFIEHRSIVRNLGHHFVL